MSPSSCYYMPPPSVTVPLPSSPVRTRGTCNGACRRHVFSASHSCSRATTSRHISHFGTADPTGRGLGLCSGRRDRLGRHGGLGLEAVPAADGVEGACSRRGWVGMGGWARGVGQRAARLPVIEACMCVWIDVCICVGACNNMEGRHDAKKHDDNPLQTAGGGGGGYGGSVGAW